MTMNWAKEEHELAKTLNTGRAIVVNVRKSGPHARLVRWLLDRQFITYVGHSGRYHDWPESDFANPFYREAARDREGVVARYEAWLAEQPELLRRIADGELAGRALGCWCAPLACHADILAARANKVSGALVIHETVIRDSQLQFPFHGATIDVPGNATSAL